MHRETEAVLNAHLFWQQFFYRCALECYLGWWEGDPTECMRKVALHMGIEA